MLPVSLDLRGRSILIVGGGSVGLRRAMAVIEAQSEDHPVRVQVVDPAPIPADWPSTIARTQAAYHVDQLEGVELVFACASSVVNAQVVHDALARRLWVADAAEPSRGNLHLPAVVRTGPLTLTIATGGAAPALTRRLRERWQAECDSAFVQWVELLAELRPVVLATVPDPVERRTLFDGLADWPWLEHLRREGVAATRAAMQQQIASLRESP